MKLLAFFSLPLFIGLTGCRSGGSQDESSQANDQSDQLYTSSVFTPAGLFTKGIEGPAVDQNGDLYIVNFQKEGTIGKVSQEGGTELFVTLPEGSTGNGIRFQSAGSMLVADYTGHNVLQVDMASREITVYAHEPSLNQPNDVAITRGDIVFCSDPNWSESTGNLWRVDTNGEFTLLEGDMGSTNGVEVSPDEKTLYVNESVQRNVWAYDLSPQGDISNKRLLLTFPDFGMDGMRCDAEGNLFITRHGKGAVAMVSPQGQVLREITLSGKKPSNIAFGGPDGRTCYVTLQDDGSTETFRTEFPGRSWKIQNVK